MRRFVITLSVAALALTGTPGRADGLFGKGGPTMPSIPGVSPAGTPATNAGPIGGSFTATGVRMQNQLLIGLKSMVNAVALMQEAVGHKDAADKLRAIADALKDEKEPKSDQIEQTLKAIEDNPVDRAQLAAVKDEKSKKLLVQSFGNMTVAGIYNAGVVNSARQLTSLRPGIADALAAPTLLNMAQIVVTSVPAEIDHTATYLSMLSDYMTTNKLSPPSKDDQRKLAEANGASKDEALALLKD
jgi:hypothetical protein